MPDGVGDGAESQKSNAPDLPAPARRAAGAANSNNLYNNKQPSRRPFFGLYNNKAHTIMFLR